MGGKVGAMGCSRCEHGISMFERGAIAGLCELCLEAEVRALRVIVQQLREELASEASLRRRADELLEASRRMGRVAGAARRLLKAFTEHSRCTVRDAEAMQRAQRELDDALVALAQECSTQEERPGGLGAGSPISPHRP